MVPVGTTYGLVPSSSPPPILSLHLQSKKFWAHPLPPSFITRPPLESVLYLGSILLTTGGEVSPPRC